MPMEDSVIIYGRDNCPHTKRARDAYPDAVFHDVKADPSKLEEMLKLSEGVEKIPVLVINGKAEVGFKRGC